MLLQITTLARNADDTDISDLTASVRTGPATWAYDDAGALLGLEVPFDIDPTPSEVDAIIVRFTTKDAAEEDRRTTVQEAINNLADVADSVGDMTITELTNAVRVLAQVQVLLRQGSSYVSSK